MKTIVSVTPLPVSADSRTFKIAASFTRFGYRSIVIEGEKSNVMLADLPFELFSSRAFWPNKVGTASLQQEAYSENRRSLQNWSKQWINRRPMPVRKLLKSLISPVYYFYNYVIRTFNSIPLASLYYLHAPYQFPAVYWLSRRAAVPIIYDAHDFYPVVHPSRFYKQLEEWCIRKAVAVITVSEGVARLMQNEFGCRPIILRNCHDERLDREPTLNLRKSLGLADDIFLLCVVGQAKAGQSILELLEALELLPSSVHLAMVGKNTDDYKEKVKLAGLQERVHLLPPVTPEQVVPYIKSANASVILYYPKDEDYQNSLPNKFFQGISAGLPLLYPELPAIKKLAEQYGLGLAINPKSTKSIRKAVMELLMDKNIVSNYKKNALRARKALSWEQEEGILRELVETLLNTTSQTVI